MLTKSCDRALTPVTSFRESPQNREKMSRNVGFRGKPRSQDFVQITSRNIQFHVRKYAKTPPITRQGQFLKESFSILIVGRAKVKSTNFSMTCWLMDFTVASRPYCNNLVHKIACGKVAISNSGYLSHMSSLGNHR